MDSTSGKLFCTIVCLGIASLAGFAAMGILMVLLDWSLLQALFAAAIVWAGLSALLVGLVCGSVGVTADQSAAKARAEMAAAREALQNVPPAGVAKPVERPHLKAPDWTKVPEAAMADAPPRAKAADPAPAPAPAAAPVAAPAPTPEPAAAPAVAAKPEGLAEARGGQADNLKEIKGVGPKLEALLHSMGYFHFDQIAAWTDKEVAWVDENLEGFKGRVTRDGWVAQAKILASGGETEFSKRVEGGDVY